MTIRIGDSVKIINDCAMFDKRSGVVTHKLAGTDYCVVDIELSDGHVMTTLSHERNLTPVYESFVDDEEKMRDFFKLSREEFLKSYSYLTEEEYDATLEILRKSLENRTKK